MNKNAVFIAVLFAGVLTLVNSCKKDDNTPTEKKKYAWATGQLDCTGYGMLLFTPDAGDSWERQGMGQEPLKGVNLIDIWAIDENTVWVTGDKNTLLKTTDGGLNWNKVQLPANLPDAGLASIFVDEKTNIWVAGITGNTGIIYKSTDGGNNFVLLDTTFFQKNGIQGIWLTASGNIFVAGPRYHDDSETLTGFIGWSQDGGTSWDSIVPDNNFNQWEWIGAVSSGNTVVVYGGKGKYTASTDGGNSWKNDSIPIGGVNGADINHMIMLDDQTWWAACDLGNIWITNNGGEDWAQQTNISGNVSGSFLVGLDNWDSNIALIVASGFYNPPDGPIIKTINGGDAWKKVFTSNVPLWKVSFIRD